jgi:D-amino-acid oxidase
MGTTQNEINRRAFLRGTLATSAVVIADSALGTVASAALRAATHGTLRSFPALNAARSFAPVKVARNRIIRTIVGLRPFRPEGFVVKAERLGNKHLIHNYGHGGSGVTLLWGSSSLAVDLVRGITPVPRSRRSRIRPKRFAVMGCGVVGLSTALLLQQRFQDGPGTVTIYAKDLPPQTTSNIAGALWHASSVFDAPRVTPAFTEQFGLACRISHRTFQELVGTEYGVAWTDTFELLRNEGSLQREPVCGTIPHPAIQVHRDPQSYFGYPYARQFSTMMIEPHTYLRALLRDFYVAGGRVVVKEFRSREELARLSEPIVFNCTGLGARTLFDDQTLIPVRGQLEVLLPQPEVDYCYLAGGSHMFPRRDGIILGGVWDRDDWSLEPDAEQTTQILEANAEIMKGLRS